MTAIQKFTTRGGDLYTVDWDNKIYIRNKEYPEAFLRLTDPVQGFHVLISPDEFGAEMIMTEHVTEVWNV